MRSSDTFKSSDTIDTTILDIPQDDNQASLTSPDGDYFIRSNIGCGLLDTYKLVQELTDIKMKDINQKMEDINRKRLVIRGRTNSLIKRQRKLLVQNDGSDVNLSSIINLNVGGKKMEVSRNLLNCLKGSRLEVLLSGRFENKILRDNKENIFLDVDPDIFRRVIESLYLIKISNNEKTTLMLNDIHKDDEDLRLLVKFLFKEPESSNEELFSEDDNRLECNNLVTSIITKEEKLSLVIENKLKSIEERLSSEESLIELFVRSPKQKNDGSRSISNKIVTLEFLNGEHISVKHSTLCLEENSLLAKQFNDEEWVNAHKSKEKDSGDVIITEQSVYFKKMINRLRLRAILDSGCKLPTISVTNMDEGVLFHEFVSKFFPGNEGLILGDDIMQVSPRRVRTKQVARLSDFRKKRKHY